MWLSPNDLQRGLKIRYDTQAEPYHRGLHSEFIRAKNRALLNLEIRLASEKVKPGRTKHNAQESSSVEVATSKGEDGVWLESLRNIQFQSDTLYRHTEEGLEYDY